MAQIPRSVALKLVRAMMPSDEQCGIDVGSGAWRDLLIDFELEDGQDLRECVWEVLFTIKTNRGFSEFES